MKQVSIDVSPKQLSRLRNGHKVRIKQGMEGKGVNLLVDPSKFDPISRSFSKGSAYTIQLSPDELMANKQAVTDGQIEGQGIYAGGKLNLKKVGRTLKRVGRKVIKGIRTAEQAIRKNPVTRKLVKKVLPLLASKAVEGVAMYAGADPKMAQELGKLGAEGSTYGLTKAGYGLYAGQEGRGMCGGMLSGPPSRLPEMSSVAIGGNLLARGNSQLPPALQSDPMGANFHMSTQLPPQLQRCRFV